MFDQLRIVDELLKSRRVKRAEMLINRQIRRKKGQDAIWLIQRARSRLLTGRPAAALDDMLRAQTLQPELLDHVINLQILADCYFARFESSTVGFVERNDALIAERLYQQIITAFPEYNNVGWAYYQLGCLFLTGDRVDEATTAFQTALQKPAQTTPSLTAYSHERLAFIYFYEHRQISQALKSIRDAINAYPHFEDKSWLVQAYLLQSRILRSMGDIDAALEASQKAVRLAKKADTSQQLLAEALFTFGELLSVAGGQETASIQTLERFLEVSRRPIGIDVTWARVHEILGDLYFKLSNFEASVAAYNLVLQFNPHYPWEDAIYHRIARAYYQLGSYDKVIEALKRAFEMAANDGREVDYQLYTLYGAACLAAKQYDAAVDAYEKALHQTSAYAEISDQLRQYRDFALTHRSASPGSVPEIS